MIKSDNLNMESRRTAGYLCARRAVPSRVHIYIPNLDNDLLIENGPNGVIITATRNNISERRKAAFIRHLAAEGFIPDWYQWFSDPAKDGFRGASWVVAATPEQNKPRSLRAHCTRRNAIYGSLFLTWLLFFVWAVRFTAHGL